MKNLYSFFYDTVFDTYDFLKYEVFRFIVPIKVEIPKVPNSVNVTIHTSPNLIWAESEEYPGIFASGSNHQELWHSLNDAIYAYFGVPRYIAKKLGNKFDLPLSA